MQITVSRAIVKGNSASLIAKLARDTAEKYSEANFALKAIDTEGAKIAIIRQYFSFKEHIFLALGTLLAALSLHFYLHVLIIAYYQHAKQFSKDHTGGSSVAAVRKAVELLEMAVKETQGLPYGDDAQRVVNSYMEMLKKDAKKLEEENERIYFDRY